jgi:hypothetical protein
MSIIIDILNLISDKRTYVWNINIYDIEWHDIFHYISSQINIPSRYLQIRNHTKIYKYDNIQKYNRFQSIINNFRYKNVVTSKYVNTLYISLYINA